LREAQATPGGEAIEEPVASPRFEVAETRPAAAGRPPLTTAIAVHADHQPEPQAHGERPAPRGDDASAVTPPAQAQTASRRPADVELHAAPAWRSEAQVLQTGAPNPEPSHPVATQWRADAPQVFPSPIRDGTADSPVISVRVDADESDPLHTRQIAAAASASPIRDGAADSPAISVRVDADESDPLHMRQIAAVANASPIRDGSADIVPIGVRVDADKSDPPPARQTATVANPPPAAARAEIQVKERITSRSSTVPAVDPSKTSQAERPKSGALVEPPVARAATPGGPAGNARAPAAVQVNAAPTVQVTIGRIELRAAAPAAAPTPSRAAIHPTLSLAEYLRRRNAGDGR
jgi:hypothetical protein